MLAKQATGARSHFSYGEEKLKTLVFSAATIYGRSTYVRTYFHKPAIIEGDKHVTLVYDFMAESSHGYVTEYNMYALKKTRGVFLNILVRLPGRKAGYDTPGMRERINNEIGVAPIDVEGYKNKGYTKNFFIEINESYLR